MVLIHFGKKLVMQNFFLSSTHRFFRRPRADNTESVVVSSRNWNLSKLSCVSLLPTRMKIIHTKMKELEWSQHFPHYKSMGIFQDAQGQLTPQS